MLTLDIVQTTITCCISVQHAPCDYDHSTPPDERDDSKLPPSSTSVGVPRAPKVNASALKNEIGADALLQLVRSQPPDFAALNLTFVTPDGAVATFAHDNSRELPDWIRMIVNRMAASRLPWLMMNRREFTAEGDGQVTKLSSCVITPGLEPLTATQAAHALNTKAKTGRALPPDTVFVDFACCARNASRPSTRG